MAALGTPWGRFEKTVQDAVGSRWYYYVAQRSGNMLTPDTVQVKFYVRPDGRVEQPRILGAPANETLALLCASIELFAMEAPACTWKSEPSRASIVELEMEAPA